jgi:hypothetical protein
MKERVWDNCVDPIWSAKDAGPDGDDDQRNQMGTKKELKGIDLHGDCIFYSY